MNPERLMTLPCELTYVTENGAADEYNNPTDETETVSALCWYEQTNRSEDTNDTNQQSSTWNLYLPPTVNPDGLSRVTIFGDVFEFAGPPWRAWNPRLRRVTHIEATLARVDEYAAPPS